MKTEEVIRKTLALAQKQLSNYKILSGGAPNSPLVAKPPQKISKKHKPY